MSYSQQRKEQRYSPIADYGVIGNLHTVALISKAGSIDYFPYMRIDSPTIFASVLDADNGGSFDITPQFEEMDYKQLYLPDSAILLTRFLSDEGLAEITDFMPVKKNEENCVLSRTVRTVKGKITYKMHCRIRPNYGKEGCEILKENGQTVFYYKGESLICMNSTADLQIDGDMVKAEFELKENETLSFVLYSPNEKADIDKCNNLEAYTDAIYQKTARYWINWIDKCDYNGAWREDIHRSAITLKLLTSYRFGSIVAAATFGLPENLGGTRNWDYRYTWIRDAAFSMYALIELNFMDEAEQFMQWISRRSEEEHLQLMYTVDGKADIREYELDHMEGYRKSRPVRVGNAAHHQLQLDIYGELIDTIYLYNKHVRPITHSMWSYIRRQVSFVIENWEKADCGIWEIRSDKREMLSSRVMCWVALDRAIRIGDDRSYPYPYAEWIDARNAIYKDIYENFWNEELQSFVQYKGSKILDASILLMPLVKFISPNEPKWVSTFKAIEKNLVTDMLVYRYNTENSIDGIGTEEGTFTMCSFWYIENLALMGHVEKARLQFEKMLGYANHLGLFSEQLGMRGDHLGNYPQAFTHLALISAAASLNKEIAQKGNSFEEGSDVYSV